MLRRAAGHPPRGGLIRIEDSGLGLQNDVTLSHENYRRKFGRINLAHPIWQANQQQQSIIPIRTLNSFNYTNIGAV